MAPSLLLDLGGHTADNHLLLTQRLTTVQATYLGFYGPTYAACCDWWIVDRALVSGLIVRTLVRRLSGPSQGQASVTCQTFTVCQIPGPLPTRNPITRLRQF